MTDDATFNNGTVQRVDFKLIRSHYAVTKLLQLAQLRKKLAIHKNHRGRYRTLSENPDIPEKTRMILKSTQTTKKRRHQLRKKHFFITNIVKGHKVIDLTRPNKLGTTTSKVATRSPGRTQLWKRLRAPSYNTA
jgi:hypothetical protein